MKKIIIINIILLLTITILNAQKCKPKFIEEDAFATNVEYWGSNVSGHVSSYGVEYLPSIFFYTKANEVKIVCGMKFTDVLNRNISFNDQVWFEKDSEFLLKLGTDILTFKVEKSKAYNFKYTVVELHSTISKENLYKIKNQGILKGRILPFKNGGEGFMFQFSTSKSSLKNLNNQLNCFLNILPNSNSNNYKSNLKIQKEPVLKETVKEEPVKEKVGCSKCKETGRTIKLCHKDDCEKGHVINKCSDCNGNFKDHKTTCSKCSGDGCEYCDYDGEACNACDKGLKNEIHTVCNGSGTIKSSCSDCNGKGFLIK